MSERLASAWALSTMNYAIRLIKAISPALVIVAVAAFLLGAIYEALAYTETLDQYAVGHTNYSPTADLNKTDMWIPHQQSFTTGTSTTNLSRIQLFGNRNNTNCGAYDDFIWVALCSGETPGSVDIDTYVWPCNGGSSLREMGFSSLSVVPTSNSLFYATTTSAGEPWEVMPSTQYYLDIKTFHHNTDSPCVSLGYANDSYADGRLWSGTYDLYFETWHWSEFGYGSSTGSLLSPLATSAPMIVVPTTWSCCYDNSDPCEIPVYFNEGAVTRETSVMLDEYHFSYFGPVMEMKELDYSMNYATELEYTPKETTGVANQARVTEVWTDTVNGLYDPQTVDHIVNLTWRNCGGAIGGLTVTNLLSDPGCVCTESAGLFECGLTRASCWLFNASATTTASFEQSRNRLLAGFPFNIFYQTQKKMQIIDATDWKAGEIDFYFVGYPDVSTSTLIGSINGEDMRTTLDTFGWAYIYFIMQKMIQLGFFGLILWRLWTIITGADYSADVSGQVDQYKGKVNKPKPIDLRYQGEGHVINLRNIRK